MSKVDDDDMLPLDEVVEAWQCRARQKPWWHEALQHLRPTAEDVPDLGESGPDDQAERV
jgi:hypothetical protein